MYSLVHLVDDVQRLVLYLGQYPLGNLMDACVAKLAVCGVLGLVESVGKEEDGGLRVDIYLLLREFETGNDTHRHIANIAAEAGISINAFVKRALNEAVKHPWVTPGSRIQEYGTEEPEPQMLMEPEGPRYGAREELKLNIPAKDLAFAKDLAKRLGWDIK